MKRNRIVFTFILIVTTFILASCQSKKENLTIGMIPLREEAILEEDFEATRIYLEQQLGQTVEFAVMKSYANLIDEMENETIDIGFYGAFSYVVAGSELDLTPLVTQQIRGTGAYYQSLIIAKKESNFHSIEDLEGTTFAFAEEGSTSGFVIPYALFKSRNIDYESYFEKHTYSGTHEKVVLDILSGKVDAGAISSVQFDYLVRDGKMKKEDINILWKSEDIPASLFAARGDLDEEVIDGFIDAMLNMHEANPKAVNAFDESLEKYVIAKDNEYNQIRNISAILGKEYMRDNFLK